MTNHEQCKEEIIELLTTISEVIWSGGLLLLDMMHRGYLDELLTEDDEEYNKKVEILKRHKDLLMDIPIVSTDIRKKGIVAGEKIGFVD